MSEVEVGKLTKIKKDKNILTLPIPDPSSENESLKAMKKRYETRDSPPIVPFATFAQQPSDLSTASATLAPPIAPGLQGPLTIANSFEGLNRSSPFAWIPPDVQVAAGPNHIVEMVNRAGAVYDKQGVSMTTFALEDFFGAVGSDLADPRVLYDYQSRKWFAVMFEIDHVNHDPSQAETTKTVYLKVSQSSDPTGSWQGYSIDYGTICPDQPKIGISTDKLVVSSDTINQCRGDPGTFVNYGPEYLIMNKSELITGGEVQISAYSPDDVYHPIHPSQANSDSSSLYMVRYFGDGSDAYHVTVYSISGSVPNEIITTTNISIGPSFPPPSAIQPRTSLTLDTHDNRVLTAHWYENKLWFALNEGCIPQGDMEIRSCFRLVEINTLTMRVTQHLHYGTAGYYYFYPALRMDGEGNLDIIFGFSSATSYPSLAYVGRKAVDPPNTLQNSFILVSGSASANDFDAHRCGGGFAGCRYGDYFGAGVDPVDPGKVWIAGQFQAQSSPFSIWKTQIASMVRSTVTTTTDKSTYNIGESVIVQGTVTGAVPGQLVTITIHNPSGEVYRIDQVGVDSDRTYTDQFPIGGSPGIPGTYMVTASYNGASEQTSFEGTQAPFPVLHMFDTTQTVGSVTYSGRQINAEYVSPASQLVGDTIDSITLRLQRIGSATGTAEVGVFNTDLSVKKLFGTVNVAMLSTTFQDYEFRLTGNELYTIQNGDRIGIKYNAGTTSNAISVMNDRDPLDPFDASGSYRTRYETSWIASTSEDLYMILKQTHSDTVRFPITHMSDTTISFASLVSAPRQLMTEYVTPTSQLVGDKIDSITIRLQRVGDPTGTAEIGIFNTDSSVKKLFGMLNVSTLSTISANYEFKLPVADPLYVIASGDRIGIKYTGGTTSAGINVTPDRDLTDPFDGTDSYRARFETAWITSTGEDMYMILKQTRADAAYPIMHMSDTTISFASLVSAPRQLMTEYVTPSSQLVGDKIDSIIIRLQKVGGPTGTAQIGVFNADLSVKQLFSTIDVTTISTIATDYEFHLSGGALYTIESGDRIGIKYTGGSGTAGINVTPDRDGADPFDGTNSYRARFESSWLNSTTEDMYMILRQTHG